MQIRRAQMQQMLETDGTLLRTTIAKRVREQYAEVINGLPNDLVNDMIENGIKTARGYGLTQAEDIAGFVLVMFEVGPEFHSHPRIQVVLTDPAVASEQKLATVFARTPDRVWDEIVSTLHSQTWFPDLRQPDAD